MEHKARRFLLAALFVFCFHSVTLAAAQPVAFKRSGDHIDVLIGGRLFTTYYFDFHIAKPYLQPLRSAQGTIITRDFPIGNTVPAQHTHDKNLEPHQRDLFFGHGDIDGIDFWGEAAFPNWSDDTVFGRTLFRKLNEIRGGPQSGALRANYDLVGPRGRVIADETQSYTFRGGATTRIIDCQFVILADHGSDVTMGDTKEGTFGVRLVKALNSPPARMVNSNGAVGEKEVWGKRADWVDYDGVVNGEEVGIAVFDSPRSFHHPTYWHARGYGLLAANPFGIREFTNDPKRDGSWTIREHESLMFRYRVLIHHGTYVQAGVAKAYQEYATGE
ncbi:MAG: PmoA family protein [Terriglobia bacterium]